MANQGHIGNFLHVARGHWFSVANHFSSSTKGKGALFLVWTSAGLLSLSLSFLLIFFFLNLLSSSLFFFCLDFVCFSKLRIQLLVHRNRKTVILLKFSLEKNTNIDFILNVNNFKTLFCSLGARELFWRKNFTWVT